MEEFHKRSAKRKRKQQHMFGRYSLEERKKIKEKSRARHNDPQRNRKRRRDWSDEEAFEKIRTGSDRVLGRDAGTPRRAPGVEVVPGAETEVVGVPGLVLSVRRTGALVRVAQREFLARVPRGLRLAVGDDVRVAGFEKELPYVSAALPRRTELVRPDPGNASKALLLAANVDLAILVLSVVSPPLRPRLIDRFLVALSRGGVEPLLCVNKLDLLDRLGRLEGHEARVAVERELLPYRELGLPIALTSAQSGEGIERLREHLAGRTCVFVGHSGTGKSSLLNALDPRGARDTGGLRESDGKGRHTTTGSELVELDGGTRLIDTPGVRAFGMWDLDAAGLRAAIPEFEAFASSCRFSDCSHVHEPACGVLEAVESGELPRARYEAYRRILDSLKQ